MTNDNFTELKRAFDMQTQGDGQAIVRVFIDLLDGKSIYAAKRIFMDAYRKVETVNKISASGLHHLQKLDPNE